MYKLNHYIPRSLLKNWGSEGITNNQKYNGVWCYLIQEDRIFYSESKGKKAFSFAIVEDLYVPVIEGLRHIHFEGKWLSGLENAFANFTNQLNVDNPELRFNNLNEMTKFLMGFYSFKYRSKYDFEQVTKYLEENQDDLKKISNSKNIHVAVLENIIHATTEMYLRNLGSELIIAKFLTNNVIIGDRPFIYSSKGKGISWLPINPSTIISINKWKDNNHPHFPLAYKVVSGDNSFVQSFNQIIAQSASYWIVSHDLETLKKNIPYCIGNSNKKGSIIFEPIQTLPYGWSIE
ncbi:DUF4238 domain-containing protein [Leptospira interrogans]|uniref:DUF4238 domain-containing protein n=1 Tax=Leptospira interrogans serovar Hardjo str. Norma TaxID=1279460 RepID=A0A0M4MTG9_LEPIR|nr:MULTISPECIES: DUF4238 domain-containing protein [Leptospira]ALO00280.1 hypothetical protein LIH_07930 [Leptospira interrogans serovar Hardjo-prajitno]AJR14788.1 hypothetical protein LIL_12186 [Leptospira interrogans serovar Linhai str. 56609]ALE39108.1 hypothetical protein G436_1920 [Leptospira interrogans serovar Hardjo str. Norma]EKO95692.1 PF14022 family protein [Leptospira interrogans str. Brem 329]EMN66113.1 PF14022 family protein [Leptospira interrogans serovar Grippotyphosa str. UI 0